MLQQTQVTTVVDYYRRFTERFPDFQSLAQADLEEVLKVWEGLGYYARARNLHRAAQMVCSSSSGQLPATPTELRHLPGIGDYIAAAVASIAFGYPAAAVDGNVKRVLARVLLIEEAVNAPKYHPVFNEAANRVLDRNDPSSFNQAMMELGATVCTPKQPACSVCPVVALCGAHTAELVETYPKRLPRRRQPTHQVAVGVVRRGSKLLITRRKPEGLLGGLWEFPGGRINDDESPAEACVREIAEETNLHVAGLESLTHVRHAYTHFKIEMEVFTCHYRSGRVRLNGPVDYRWVTPEQLADYPFPKANNKFIPLLLSNHRP